MRIQGPTGFWAACSRIGAWSARHWGLVFAAWGVLLALAIASSSTFSERLRGGIGSVPGSGSEAVERSLATEFDSPFAQFLLVLLEPAPGHDVPLPIAGVVSDRLAHAPQVSRIMPLPIRSSGVRGWIVGLRAVSLETAESQVAPVRRLVQATCAGYPDVTPLVTGQAAFDVDLAAHSAAQSSAAERRVLPLTLLALLLSFGALGATLAPLVSGASAVVLALGIVSLVAACMPLSIYAANISTMLGLGLGIDYALFVVSRIREEASPLAPDRASVHRAMAHAAPAIVGSAGTVLIGLVILASVPVQDLIGIGIGGAAVALTSAAAGISLLPALVAALGPWVDAPRALSARLGSQRASAWWEARARWVVERPIRSVAFAAVILLLLILPMARLRLGFPEMGMFPRSMEAIRGADVLEAMNLGGASRPLLMVVSVPQGESLLTRSRLVGLTDLTAHLRRDPRILEVYALADPTRGASQLLMGATVMGPQPLRRRLPETGRWLVSRDTRKTSLQIVLHQHVSNVEATRLGHELARLSLHRFSGLHDATLQVGGLPALQNDLTEAAETAFPRVVLSVVGATLVMLFAMTRSWLIPVKAVLANLLTVTAALGGTVALFQSDQGAHWLGLEGPVEHMAPGIPMVVFCVVFGLSMDYEVFLIARIREAYHQSRDNREAVVRGVAASGRVITSAAVIMAIVFEGFAMTQLLPLQMLGVSLALGVILDATVVRLLLVPGLMVLAGRYNWLPGEPTWDPPPKAERSVGI